MTESPSEAATPSLSYVVPTIGIPEHLANCLESIYRDGERLDAPSELVIVSQAPVGQDAGGSPALKELCRRLAAARPGAIDGPVRVVELPRPAGFARAVNDGIAFSSGDWVALVNDDVVLEAGWARRLLEAAGAAAGVAAVQGVNVAAGGDGEDVRVDGAGLAWNRRWQAVQLGRGEETADWRGAGLRPARAPGRLRRQPAGTPAHPVCDDDLERESPHAVGDEVYGVSATAAIYRRAALAAVNVGGSVLRPFEERLDSYYEDVELADRLRGAGYRALLVPAARAVHAGALSSRSPRAARRRTRRVYANRLLVLARRLGRGFWPRLPVVLGRDVVDVLRRPKTPPMPGDLRAPGVVDLVSAWGRAVRLLPWFAHFGRFTEERSRPDGRRVSKPPSAAAGGDAGAPSVRPLLTAVAPHWHDEEHLAVLIQDWPGDDRFELIVVDNGSDGDPGELATDRPNVSVLRPGRNLGFGAAVNRGAAEAGGDLILLLNTDAIPESGALDALVDGMTNHPDAAGLAPRLLGADDTAQAAWQLRRLPTLRTLAGYCCFVEPAPLPEPAAGAPVEQPAACALLLRRSVFESAGAMDERFWPAWFEDVDLARRLADRGEVVLYWPEAVFRHGLGASVPRLGYGAFLAAYYRNLDRYARKHHGRGAALLLRGVLVGAALLRIVLLPLRRPRRARGREEALAGLWRLAVAAVGGWRER
ncbi:MAG: glycosyltransferase [Acidobacteriota bacterium]|nr:glycosyltransferase [Acidobacteriota bacterium]MDE3263335.1 glycosyltransferase [Acidobacteriota bacterium]